MLYKEKAYTRINWKNRPNLSTPLGAKNLNKMDATINELDDRILEVSSEVEKDSLNIVLMSGELNTLKEDVDENTSQINELSSLAEDVNGLKIVNTASGTTAYMDDASNMNIENIVFYGESKQIPQDILFSPSVVFAPLTESGITVTPVANNGFKISGTNTSTDSSVYYDLYYSKTDMLCSETFVFDTGVPDGTIDYMYYEYPAGGGSFMKLNTSAKTSTITVGKGISGQQIRLYIPKGKTINTTIYPTVKPVNPSPNYPQPIEMIKGKNELDCRGLTTQTITGVKFTPVYKNGLLEYVNVNGTNTSSNVAQYVLNQALPFNDIEKYTLNGCPSGGSGTTFKLDCFYTGSSSFDDIGKGVTFTARKGENLKFRIVVFSGATLNNVKFYPMIRKASITDGSYTPYNCIRLDVRAKNLFGFEKSAIDVTNKLRKLDNQRLIFTKINDNSIKCNYSWGTYATGFVELNGVDGTKNYAFSFDVKDNKLGFTPRIEKYTQECTSEKLVLSIYSGSGATEVSGNEYFILENIQVEEGTTVTPFEPYQSQTVFIPNLELNGIGGVRDTIEIYSDDTGKYIQRIGKVVANKNTRFNTLELPALQRVSFTITNMLNLSGRNADVLSSHFVASIEGTIYSMFHAGTEIYLYVGVNNATDFNSFIADKEITFYYPVAEPIETALSQADIDAIKALHTYKPNTVVMNDADAEMEVEYVADAKTYIDNKFRELATAIVNQ